MTTTAVLLLALIGAIPAAVAAWLSARLDLGWTARERVFNSAAIAPTIIAVGAACFAVVVMAIGRNHRFEASELFLVQAIIAVLASFDGGLIAAYLVERSSRR